MRTRINRRDAAIGMLAATGAALMTGTSRAQVYPSRVIRIVIPVAAGGGVDTFARLIADKIKSMRDVQFIVENRTGGNGTIAGLDVLRAPPDGYTVLFHASTFNVAHLVLRNAPYNPVTDFTPIALAGDSPQLIIIANNRPEKTVSEIVASAKQEPKAWSFATAQLGSTGHLAEIAFNQYFGTELPIIAYRGTAPAVNDIAGGHVQMMIQAMPALLPIVRGGRARAIALTKRSAVAPEIPTTAEVGMPTLDFGDWWGMWGPPGMPPELTATINGWVNEAVKGLAAEGRLAKLGIDPASETPQAFAQLIRLDAERSAKLLKAANFEPQ
jgi:tripartite-type tricarboxylate transporter receptor subunit TctC